MSQPAVMSSIQSIASVARLHDVLRQLLSLLLLLLLLGLELGSHAIHPAHRPQGDPAATSIDGQVPHSPAVATAGAAAGCFRSATVARLAAAAAAAAAWLAVVWLLAGV